MTSGNRAPVSPPLAAPAWGVRAGLGPGFGAARCSIAAWQETGDGPPARTLMKRTFHNVSATTIATSRFGLSVRGAAQVLSPFH
jgi:hypothetical protein